MEKSSEEARFSRLSKGGQGTDTGVYIKAKETSKALYFSCYVRSE